MATPVVARMKLERPATLRQSSIARFDNCALSLLLAHQSPERQPSDIAALGTLFHRWVARALNQMRAEGWTEYPIEMGMELLLEVVAQRDIPDAAVVHLPMREVKWLRICVTRWCESGPYNAQRVIGLEDQLEAVIRVPAGNGEVYDRIITGRPDALVADPPDGMIVLDWKSGWAPPVKRTSQDDYADRGDRISDHGYAQQVIYGILILANYPTVQRVTMREAYIRHREGLTMAYRESSLERWQLERVTDIVGAVVSQIDAAFDAGPESERWIPTAGPHCSMCPAPRKCPLKDWHGIPTTEEEAIAIAREWIVAAKVREERLPWLKGWVDVHGPIPLDAGKGRREVGWPEWDGDPEGTTIHRGRGPFKVYEPQDAPDSPFDARLMEALRRG